MFEKQVKRLKLLDIAIVKLGVAAFLLFVIGIWPAANNWALSVNPWYFLIIAVVLAIIVEFRVWK